MLNKIYNFKNKKKKIFLTKLHPSSCLSSSYIFEMGIPKT